MYKNFFVAIQKKYSRYRRRHLGVARIMEQLGKCQGLHSLNYVAADWKRPGRDNESLPRLSLGVTVDLMLDDQWLGVGYVRGRGELGDDTRVDGRADDLKTCLEISLPFDGYSEGELKG